MIVLGYLRNTTKKFHAYVTNRVERIRALSAVKDWHHVPTDINPADVASRGAHADALVDTN